MYSDGTKPRVKFNPFISSKHHRDVRMLVIKRAIVGPKTTKEDTIVVLNVNPPEPPGLCCDHVIHTIILHVNTSYCYCGQ